jgi:thymidylate synthase
MISVVSTTLNDAFHLILYKFFEKNVNTGVHKYAYTTDIDAGSFGKDKMGDEENPNKRLQSDLTVAEITHPEVRPMAVTFPEASGIPPVATDDAIETYFSSYLMNAEITKNEEYTYGSRLLDFPMITDYNGVFNGIHRPVYQKKSFSQIDWIIEHFKKYPYNNHCTAEIGKGDDVLLEHAPCLRLISWKIVPTVTGIGTMLEQQIEDRLSITVFFRSWDFWSGFPTNLGGLQLLNEYVADAIGVKPGKMFAVSDGLHIYSHNLQFAKQRLGILDEKR